MENYILERKCRICSGENLQLVLDLGNQPPANSLLEKTQINEGELKFPLRLYWCSDCFLVQLLDIVSKEHLFQHYLYMTSASKPIVSHFEKYAKSVFDQFLKNSNNPLVIEIGSNDGSLLGEFKKLGVQILGIEPASNLAKLSNDLNIDTLNEFFSLDIAKQITESRTPSVIVANNVIGHIENLHNIMEGIKVLIGKTGVFIFEVPYLIDLIKNLEFDTIYHEHLSYFSLLPLNNLIEQFGLEIFDVQKQDVHGGSIRVFVSVENNFQINDSVKKMINDEHEFGLEKIDVYKIFSVKIGELKKDLKQVLVDLKKEGKSIFGYGAPAKGNVLLNYCDIDNSILEFIIDTTPIKQGKFTPGTHIPIVSPSNIMKKGVGGTALLLAWNYEREILEKEKESRNNGGKFVIPIPSPVIK